MGLLITDIVGPQEQYDGKEHTIPEGHGESWVKETLTHTQWNLSHHFTVHVPPLTKFQIQNKF